MTAPRPFPPEVAAWNATGRPFPADSTLPDLLDDAARRHPNAAALRNVDGREVTHAQLARNTAWCAERLAGAGVGRGTAVGILADHDFSAVTAIIAIVRAGGFYIPLDPRWPVSRCTDIVRSLNVSHLIIGPGFERVALEIASAAPDLGMVLMTPGNEPVPGERLEPANPAIAEFAVWSDLAAGTVVPPTATDLAYTITTSGSTGVPKAVAIRHRSVVNLIDWFNRRNSVGPADTILQATAFSFDLSVYDIFGVLAAGGSVLLMPDEQLAEPGAVVQALIGSQVTLWDSAPAAFTALLPFLRLAPREGRQALRRVFLSGDWVPLSTHAELAREFPNAVLVALGGATEACVWSNDFVVTHVDPEWSSIPYGNPMQNARYYVLDENGAPCELDEPGELYIAGECVAAGYLNDPQLSARRFLPDPWDSGRSLMYRTGDRARWTRHGWVEFLGRLDQQVKVRGYRIELGEIEQAAQRLPGIHEAVALAYGESRDPSLGLVVRAPEAADWRAVRDQLRAYLPSYMVPNRIRVVTSMPVSPTGKVDRKALFSLLTADPDVGGGARKIRILSSGTGRQAA